MSFTHSIMFHHFHSSKHLPSQGSLSAKEFDEMLQWLIKKYTIIDAEEYVIRFESGNLAPDEVCLSFDDALLCQYDVALPVLKRHNIKAFFFVYSSVFTGDPNLLEIFTHFRNNYFDNIDEFYQIFFDIVKKEDPKYYREHFERCRNLSYLKNYPFYTKNDRWFRYLRDQVLGLERYNEIMTNLMDYKSFDKGAVANSLWMTEENLKTLKREGHIIGLHSMSHPTKMSGLSRAEQEREYSSNLNHLEGILGKNSIFSMSHPCGDYNEDTLDLLSKMSMRIGFRSSLTPPEAKSCLEIPRNDHTNVYKEMKNENYTFQQ